MSGSSDKNSTKGSQVFDKMEKARPKASPVLAPLPVTIKKSNKKVGVLQFSIHFRNVTLQSLWGYFML